MKCKKILTVLEFSEDITTILDFTTNMAQKNNASVCLIHSEPPSSGYAYLIPGSAYGGYLGFGDLAAVNQEVESIRLSNDKEALEIIQQRLKKKNIKSDIKLLQGEPAWEIRKTAQEIGADLIIIGTKKQGFLGRLISETPEKGLLNNPPCPLLIIPTSEEPEGPQK